MRLHLVYNPITAQAQITKKFAAPPAGSNPKAYFTVTRMADNYVVLNREEIISNGNATFNISYNSIYKVEEFDATPGYDAVQTFYVLSLIHIYSIKSPG